MAAAQEPPPPSGYLTLIPLSDARLQPRDTRLTAAFLLLFACVVAGAVFVVVPRGVSVGEISVKADRMSWNTTKASAELALSGCWLPAISSRPASTAQGALGAMRAVPASLHLQVCHLLLPAADPNRCTPLPPLPHRIAVLQSTYQLKLLAQVPVYNPNYLAASIEGDLHILFYRTVAGEGKIERLRLPPRASPKARHTWRHLLLCAVIRRVVPAAALRGICPAFSSCSCMPSCLPLPLCPHRPQVLEVGIEC